MTKQKLKKLSEEAQHIKNFESSHSGNDYFDEDGSLTPDGWDCLKDAETNWADDIKWNDYTKFHMRSRIAEFWYGEGEESDIKYWEVWNELHPTGIMKL